MKMYCCAHGTFHCQYINGVQFEKLKTKYDIDKDIVVDYTIQDRVRTSTRDWIGIFPRGWTNLQQYLTFEYVVVPPKLSSELNRSITFPHTFDREASPNIDYQFVYVSKQVEILGTSSYFRFVLSPFLRSLDRKSDTAEIVDDGQLPSIVSPASNGERKIAMKSKSIDDVPRSHRVTRGFVDQRQRSCRFCSATRLTSSFTENKVQFLSLHNEQLMARVGRLTRDLELTEAAVKKEKTSRMLLTKKLQNYESFVAGMFRCLSIMGIVSVTDKAGKQIIVQKVKPKELSSMREEGNKPPVIPEISLLNQSLAHKIYDDEEVPRELSSLLDETVRNEENVARCLEGDTEKSVKRDHAPDPTNFDVTSIAGERSPWLGRKISITRAEDLQSPENLRGSCVTNEATGATNEQEDNVCKVDCKIEETDRVEGRARGNNTGNVTYDEIDVDSDSFVPVDLRCCQSLKASKMLDDEKKCDRDDAKGKEWALECECDLEVSIHGTNDFTKMEKTPKNENDSETWQTKPSAVLVKGRKARFTVIK